MRERVFGPGGGDWGWSVIEALAAFNFLFAVWLIVKPGGDDALVWSGRYQQSMRMCT